MMKNEYDVVIIGGGASGMTAAITLKRECPDWDVAVFEKKDVFLKKVSQTGNGRCNISNVNCPEQDVVQDFFRSIGISLRSDEEGRLYPYSEDAKDVSKLLIRACEACGVELYTEANVTRLEAVSYYANPRGGFDIYVGEDEELVYAENVVLATGGKSYANYGTTGDGYIFARRLGHQVSKLAPALTGVEVIENIRSLKGVRAKARVHLLKDGESIRIEEGEVQFREEALSGICIMNLSRYIKPVEGETPEDGFKHYEIRLDLLPDFSSSEIKETIAERLEMPGYDEAFALRTLVKEELAAYVIRKEKVFFARLLEAKPSVEEIAGFLADELADMRLKVKGLRGWNEAQVTSGGVDLEEVDPNTMESKVVPGLFITGETLDYDGPCGGYNLHNAWLTGIKAGKGLAR
ncbi:MAG: aminoacetone oxidase family FAD-binding enzyme [Firmicutes bacterium]|nr:aminoacetone oxidase family FAD-binding enzyme [Bacillota bacterium]